MPFKNSIEPALELSLCSLSIVTRFSFQGIWIGRPQPPYNLPPSAGPRSPPRHTRPPQTSVTAASAPRARRGERNRGQERNMITAAPSRSQQQGTTAAAHFLAREWRGSACGCGTRAARQTDAQTRHPNGGSSSSSSSRARFSGTVSLPGAGTDHGPSVAVARTARREPRARSELRCGHATSNHFR